MNIFELILGILITMGFGFGLVRNFRKPGFFFGWIKVETLLGLLVGVFVIIRSIL